MAQAACSAIRVRGPLFLASALVLWSAWGAPSETGALWVAESDGLLGLSAETGALRHEIPHTLGVDAVAVNDIDGDVWAFGKKRLYRYSREGHLLAEFETPPSTLGGDPAELVVDAAAGQLWLAIRREVYRFDFDGRLAQTLLPPRAVVAAALERERSRLWLAHDDTIVVYDASGVRQQTIDLRPSSVIDIAYDRARQQFWVSLADRIRRYDVHGTLVTEAGGVPGGALAPDGAGGVWLAHGEHVSHLDEHGTATVTLLPFAEGPDRAIVDLVAHPHDASIWVASMRRLAHVAIDGERLAEVNPADATGLRRLARAALYADRDPPEIRIVAPAADALLREAQPVIRLSYFDLGLGVDPDSIRLAVDGAVLAAQCVATGGTAECVPTVPMADGRHEVSASVADLAGNRSDAARRTVIVDTTPPVIRVTEPTQGFVTNVPTLTIRGGLDEPGSLALDGVPLQLDGELRFVATAELWEGANTFQLHATDLAGNAAATTVTAWLDTVAPAAPATAAIAVTLHGTEAVVAGGPGAAEAGARVRVTNLRTGLSATAPVAADGSFRVVIEAAAGDEIAIAVVDAAGNASESVAHRLASAFQVAIVEPAHGVTLRQHTVLVIGTLTAPPNTAVSVNGAAATVLPRADRLEFYASVALAPGVTTITAVATAQSGATTQASVNVSRTTESLAFAADTVAGLAPMAVRFSLTGPLRLNEQTRIDFNGDGIFDASSGSLNGLFGTHTFAAPGLHRPRGQVRRFNVNTGQWTTVFDETIGVAVFDAVALEQQLDQLLRNLWQGLNDALVAGDVPRALTTLAFDSRPIYDETFRSLLSHMPAILGDFTDLEPLAITDTYAEYLIMNVRNGQARVHVIGFVRGTDGVWRIESL